VNIGFGMNELCFTWYDNNMVEIAYYIEDKHVVL